MSNEKEIENEIQEKGLNAPRITPDHIESIIDGVVYFTAADGYRANPCYDPNSIPSSALPAPQSLELLTFCVITLKNGFTVTGESACASPENFNAEIGRKIARENARNKIWQLEGYLLKEKLYTAKHCSDERPCVNCFTDQGKCLDSPN
ncbi:Gp49 family protein [Acinetobacter soli]|nr:Gp49 family protein [Acinetobacter soli]